MMVPSTNFYGTIFILLSCIKKFSFRDNGRIIMWKLICKDEKKLLILKISDKIDLNELSDILKTLYIDNRLKSLTYNRFTDLTELKNIDMNSGIASFHFNEYRFLIKPDKAIKISLFIPQKYIVGFSYLYKSMSGNDNFKLKICNSLDDCAKYLSIVKSELQNAIRQLSL